MGKSQALVFLAMTTKYFRKLAPKREKKVEEEAPAENAEEETPKKKQKKKPAAKTPQPKATTDISMINNRKIVNNVLHYEVKFVGKSAMKTVPLFGE